MEAKGVFFISRKQQVVATQGEKVWDDFIARLAKLDPVFARPILATTRVPIASYLRFQDESLRDLFGGEENAFWKIGEDSGEWALTVGPYKHYRENRHEFKELVERIFPQIWTNYFTEGELETKLEGNIVEGAIVGLPVWHVSFEYSVMGFMRRAIAMVGYPVKKQTRIKGVSAGDRAIRYRFEITR